MILRTLIACLAVMVFAGSANSGPAPATYIEIVVKACEPAEQLLQPTNHGKIYDNERAMTKDEREAMYRELNCVDRHVPLEITGVMTMAQCRTHSGYLASLQYVEQSPELKTRPAVGAWQCIVHLYPAGVAWSPDRPDGLAPP